jgi:hypothetical protein
MPQKSLNYVAHIFYTPHNSNKSVKHFLMHRRNIFVEHAFLKRHRIYFYLAISIFLVMKGGNGGGGFFGEARWCK